jgi:hypothetical protein
VQSQLAPVQRPTTLDFSFESDQSFLLSTFDGLRAVISAVSSARRNLKHLPEIVVDKVRREKALDFSGCNSRPGTGSLHPVAIEAAAEATKLSEPSV